MQLLSLVAAALAFAFSQAVPTSQKPPSTAGTLYTKCNRPGVIALTFDDGPWLYTKELVKTLDKSRAKATFFVSGDLYGCIYDRADEVRTILRSGHTIASHTWTHPDLTKLSEAEIRTEMKRTEQAIANIAGIRPRYMRPPYLAVNETVQKILGELDYRVVNIDVDSQDWSNLSVNESLARVEGAGAQGDGHIVLMHEPIETTARELAQKVIDWAKKNRLGMVTIEECTGAGHPYALAKKNKEWTCS